MEPTAYGGGSRANPLDASMSYTEHWDAYRRRRNLFRLVWISYVPGVLLIGVPLHWLLGSDVPIYVVAGAWMIAFIVTANCMTMSACPRCGRSFFRTFWRHNPLARRCVHCGLQKWASNGE